MSNKSSKLHFHCSFCNLIKMMKKMTFMIQFPKDALANRYQNSIWNVKFENENALAEMLFHFKVIAALCDSQMKWVINHQICIFIFFFKTTHFVTFWDKRRVWRLFYTVVHVFRNSGEITTISSFVLRSSKPWFAFGWSNQPHIFSSAQML